MRETEWMPSPPKNWQQLQPHPLAANFEFGMGFNLTEMVEFIRKYGWDDDEAIIVYQGMVLDGRHRLIAAIEAGITPTFKKYVGSDPLGYVMKKLHRQHLTPGQRAMYVLKLAKTVCAPGKEKFVGIPTQTEMANKAGISRETLNLAARVDKEGTKELKEGVSDGTLSVSDAAFAAEAPPAEQRAAVKKVKTGKKKTLRAALESLMPSREPGEEVEEPPEVDKLDQPLPERLRPAFGDLPKFPGLLLMIRYLADKLSELAHSPGGKRLRRYLTRASKEKSGWLTSEYLVKLAALIRDCKPYCVCPECEGEAEKCKRCDGLGWLTQSQHKHPPVNMEPLR